MLEPVVFTLTGQYSNSLKREWIKSKIKSLMKGFWNVNNIDIILISLRMRIWNIYVMHWMSYNRSHSSNLSSKSRTISTYYLDIKENLTLCFFLTKKGDILRDDRSINSINNRSESICDPIQERNVCYA